MLQTNSGRPPESDFVPEILLHIHLIGGRTVYLIKIKCGRFSHGFCMSEIVAWGEDSEYGKVAQL